MGKPVEKIVHEACGRRTLQVFKEEDGRHTGFCFRCHEYVKRPYSNQPEGYEPPKPKIKTKEEIDNELREVLEYPSKGIPERNLGAGTVKYFGVRTALSEADGETVTAHYYPRSTSSEIVSYNVRVLEDKKFFQIGSNSPKVEPFGYMQAMRAGSRKLFITEGEIDAMVLFKIMMGKWKGENKPAVISLHNGSNSVEKLAPFVSQIRTKFAEIIFVPDQDEPGELATDMMCKLIPEVRIAKLPLKDVDDCYKAGRANEVFNAVMFEARPRLSGQLVNASTLWEEGKKRPAHGVSWPWPELTKITRGIRTQEGYYIGAGTKMGKSCVVNEIGAHFMIEHDERVFFVKPEESTVVTARKLAGVVASKIFDDPNIEFDEDAYEEAAQLIGDKAILYNSYQKTEWKDVKEAIRHAVLAQGCKRVILDPITCFTVGMSGGERNDRLVEISSEIASLSMELDFTYFIFCHLNAPQGGPPHELGGKVQSVQFAGSRAMQRSTHYMIGLEGNKDPDIPELNNIRDLVILEDRNFGETGRCKLFYNRGTGRLTELQGVEHDDT